MRPCKLICRGLWEGARGRPQEEKQSPPPPPAPTAPPRAQLHNHQRFNPSLPRTIAQPPFNVQRGFSPAVQTSNPTFAALNVLRSGAMQQPITVDPSTRQTELRTLAAMRQRRGVVTREGDILDPAT